MWHSCQWLEVTSSHTWSLTASWRFSFAPPCHRCFLTVLQTGRAIKFAVNHVFSSSQRARQVKNRMAVVVTDGKSQDDVVNVTLLCSSAWVKPSLPKTKFVCVALNHSGSVKRLQNDPLHPQNLNKENVSLGGCQHGGTESGHYSIRRWSWQWDHHLGAGVHRQ